MVAFKAAKRKEEQGPQIAGLDILALEANRGTTTGTGQAG